MKQFLHFQAAFAAALCLTLAAVLLLTAYATTAHFADLALGGQAEQAQQTHIDTEAAALAEAYHITPEVLTAYTAQAAQTHRATIAAWWSGLFTGESDAALPCFLTAEAERTLVAAIMADEGFSAHVDADMKRAVARDEVAYAVDEAVCAAVLPLRRSVTDLALTIAADVIPLPMVRPVLLTAAGALTVAAIGLCVLLRGRSGVALLATAMWMPLLSLPVWLLDVPGMLRELNPNAGLQGAQALTALAFPWYGAAVLLAVTGWLISCRKKARHA